MIINLIKVINTEAMNNNNREERERERERRERGGDREGDREGDGGKGGEREGGDGERERGREREERRKGGREVHVHAQCNKRNSHTQLLRQKSNYLELRATTQGKINKRYSNSPKITITIRADRANAITIGQQTRAHSQPPLINTPLKSL